MTPWLRTKSATLILAGRLDGWLLLNAPGLQPHKGEVPLCLL